MWVCHRCRQRRNDSDARELTTTMRSPEFGERSLICPACVQHESWYWLSGSLPPDYFEWPVEVPMTKAQAVRRRVRDDEASEDLGEQNIVQVTLDEWDSLSPEVQELAATLLIDAEGANFRGAVDAAKLL